MPARQGRACISTGESTLWDARAGETLQLACSLSLPQMLWESQHESSLPYTSALLSTRFQNPSCKLQASLSFPTACILDTFQPIAGKFHACREHSIAGHARGMQKGDIPDGRLLSAQIVRHKCNAHLQGHGLQGGDDVGQQASSVGAVYLDVMAALGTPLNLHAYSRICLDRGLQLSQY